MDTNFPTLLRTYRKGMGWTQEELAQRWSYSFETISAWERGKRRPNNQEIPRLAKLLDVKVEDIASIIGGHRQPANISAPASASHPGTPADWRTTFEVWGELQQIYRTRTEFNQTFSYARMFEHARSILAVGISLNAIALSHSRDALLKTILEEHCTLQLSFLDPRGQRCAEREQEEGYPQGILASLTGVNIHLMQTLQEQLEKIDSAAAARVTIGVYDLTPRFNIYVVDDTLMTVQSYAYGRGEDTPTLVLERKTQGGLFDFYASAATHILEHSKTITTGPSADT
jgi:transcriptional regulator with XRE-family HTH domain